MIISNNKVFDILKWVAMVVLPAAATLYYTLASIWGFPFAEQISASITAVDAFLGVLLGVSTIQYEKAKRDD